VASAAGVNTGFSNTFNVGAEVATHLAFLNQPASFWEYSSMASPVVVATEDQYGNAASAAGATQITLSVAYEPAGAVFSGAATKTAINGVASFMGLSASLPGIYVLVARSGSLTSATSNTFAVIPVPESERFSFNGTPLGSESIIFQQLRNTQAYAAEASPTYAQALADLVGDVAVSTATATFAASSSAAFSASTASPFASGISTSDASLESQLLDGGSPDQSLLS
jgi:hypothetical protein